MLSSHLALVTGAGRGIGKAACLCLAKEKAQIIAVDIKKELVENIKYSMIGNGHSAYIGDVSDSKSINGIASEILKSYKQPPSIIVNCAGIKKDSFIINMSEQEFDEVIRVNLKNSILDFPQESASNKSPELPFYRFLKIPDLAFTVAVGTLEKLTKFQGTYLILQTFGKLLIEHNMKGSIINIGSIIGKIGNIGQCNYSASKAGVELMTKTAAKEFGRYGVRCNVILPGFIKTSMIETVPEKVKKMFAEKIALGRLGEPEEIAEVITFLASEKSSYINGATIEVTGGGL